MRKCKKMQYSRHLQHKVDLVDVATGESGIPKVNNLTFPYLAAVGDGFSGETFTNS